MSNSLLYHAFGLGVITHRRVDYVRGETHFHAEIERSRLRCPDCASSNVVARGSYTRWLRMVPIGGRPSWLCLPIPKVECLACGVGPKQVNLRFAAPRVSYTNAWQRYVVELLDLMTMAAVARHLGVGWDLVKEIDKTRLHRRFAKPKLRKLERIGVDEINVGRKRFLTLVLDFQTGAVVFVGEGRGGDVLRPFWRRLKASGARIKAVAMDMSAGYSSAVRKNLPEAEIVFDRFHVMKLFNEKLSDLRRELYRESTCAPGRKLLKGTRWLLLTNRETLVEDPKRLDDLTRLDEALALNEPLAKAYYLKEELRKFWTMHDKYSAFLFLCDWIDAARGSGVRMLDKFANTIEKHEDGLLAWFDHRISNGPLEAVNNKIGAMTRQAYGFRDQEYFTLRILGLHRTRKELVG